MDRLSVIYVACFSFLYRWEDLYYYKLLSIVIIIYFAAIEVLFVILRYTFSYKVRTRKLNLFQEKFKEHYAKIDKLVEDAIRRNFFRSYSYKIYCRDTKNECYILKLFKVRKYKYTNSFAYCTRQSQFTFYRIMYLKKVFSQYCLVRLVIDCSLPDWL